MYQYSNSGCEECDTVVISFHLAVLHYCVIIPYLAQSLTSYIGRIHSPDPHKKFTSSF